MTMNCGHLDTPSSRTAAAVAVSIRRAELQPPAPAAGVVFRTRYRPPRLSRLVHRQLEPVVLGGRGGERAFGRAPAALAVQDAGTRRRRAQHVLPLPALLDRSLRRERTVGALPE